MFLFIRLLGSFRVVFFRLFSFGVKTWCNVTRYKVFKIFILSNCFLHFAKFWPSTQKRCKNDPKRYKNDPKTIQKRHKNDTRTIQKRSKMIHKRQKNEPKTMQNDLQDYCPKISWWKFMMSINSFSEFKKSLIEIKPRYKRRPLYSKFIQFPSCHLYINLAGLSVCLYPINVKTAEPIGPKFFVAHHVTTGKVYEW